MKKYKILLVSFLLVMALAFTTQAKATMTASDLQTMIDQLKVQINQLQAQLAEMKKEPAKDLDCKFNLNLKLGDKGSDVEALQQALEKEGFNLGEEKTTKYFGILTRLAVTNFQEKYVDDILTPFGLKKGTGFVGNNTRLKLKGIYCNLTLDSATSPKVYFSYPIYSVLENEPYAVITVNLSAPSEKDVSVEYETFNGTATPGSDYYSTQGTINFVSGQTSKTFQVNIIDDNIAETDETVRLRLFNPKSLRLGDQDEAELDIIDNDHSTPSVYFNPVFYTVSENSNTVILNVSLSKVTPDTVTVNYLTSDFTATAGSDYQAANGTLTFAPNEISKNIPITILNDSVCEGNESFNVTLKNPNNARLGLRFKSTITINDDEQAPPTLPTVYFNPIIYTDSENSNVITLNVSLSKSSSNTVKVDYLTSDFTATAGSDYQVANGTLTFNPNETSKNIPITILNDSEHESIESFNVTLKNAVNANLGLLNKKATVIITDDDPAPPSAPNVYFSPVIYSVDEGSVAYLNVYLSKSSNDNVSVSYYTSEYNENLGEALGAQAVAGSDYQSANGILTFTPGQVLKIIPITTIDDNIYEGNEIFSVTLKDAVGAELGVRYKAAVIIKDNEQAPPQLPTVRFDPIFYSVNENVASVILNVSLSSASANTVTVNYLTSNFTATAGSDYQATNGVLTFIPGQVSKTIPVVILNDNIYEGNEIFNVKLENPVNAILGVLKTAIVTINDDEQAPPTVYFSPLLYFVNENAGSVVLYVSLSSASNNTVSVSYESSNFTAQAGSDYQAVNGTLTFTPGQVSKTIPVVILNDSIHEGNEIFNVKLEDPVNAILGVLKTATVIINDDDPAPPQLPTVRFDPIFYSVNENVASVILNVSLSSASNNTVSVGYESSNFSAQAGSDYQAVNGTLTFTPGQVSKTIPLTIINDNVHELTEIFNVTLKNPVNAELKVLSKTATITINDDDPVLPTVYFSPLFYSVNENNTSVILYVSLSQSSASTVTVNYLTSNFTATAGTDYQATNGILTFTPGQVLKTIPVVILDDNTSEGNEIFNVKLENAINANLNVLSKTATVTINDNDFGDQEFQGQQQGME